MTPPNQGAQHTPVVAEVVRNGFVESVHHGSVVAVGPDGSVVWSVGIVDQPMYPRSSSKPLQGSGMLRAGLDLRDPELLAVMVASHSGEPGHIELVRKLLASAGLDESALDNTATLPYDEAAAAAVLREGGGPSRILQNCSGKHAGMVATCIANGWPVEGYRDPKHPLQQSISTHLAELAGEQVSHVAVDGCGAPLLAMSLTGLARAFSRMAQAEASTPERVIADAMRAHPWAVGGTGRSVTALMESATGLFCKDGAEGVYAGALPDGSALAVKIADGASRAATPVFEAALQRLGVEPSALVNVPKSLVMGAGQPVGEVGALPL